jgi:hypothetical protein
MMNDAQAILSIAAAEIGYREQGENGNKYGSWYGMNGEPWCMMFISWCAEQAGISTDIIPKLSYCPYAVDWFQQRNRWFAAAGNQPQPGDVVF